MQLLFGYVEFHQKFGFVRVGRWKFRWRKLLWWHSPLRLRWSLRRLRTVSDHPFVEFAQMLWPFPRYWPCGPLPPPPRVLLADGDAVTARYYRYAHVQRQLPLWARRDTLQRAFFRLYEAICAADDTMIGYATEYMFFRPEPEWALDRVADPRTMATHDTDAVAGIGRPLTDQEVAERLAVMARLVVALEDVFNWRLKLGLRRDGSVEEHWDGTPVSWTPVRCPAWAHEIPALPEVLVLSHTWDNSHLEPGWHERYNIVIKGASLMTV
ncbi:hypothetical protein SPI_03630 [Niveomyces insectorum RCEF 264]|uniref:Uncharacterized protein n=1 Tax=Niveomyces insectorum RCEF 264 TaxID=1081102 RepID=A0A167W8I3_9HYPO|nr:hypothetical protein SPI_03630 [Niveomyces insectorum RCEF 264]